MGRTCDALDRAFGEEVPPLVVLHRVADQWGEDVVFSAKYPVKTLAHARGEISRQPETLQRLEAAGVEASFVPTAVLASFNLEEPACSKSQVWANGLKND